MSDETTRIDVVNHKIGECPACRSGLWAEVTIETETRPARLDDAGRPSASTSSRSTAMRIEHWCGPDAPVMRPPECATHPHTTEGVCVS